MVFYSVLTMVYSTQRYWVFGLNVVFLVISNPDDGESLKTQYLCIWFSFIIYSCVIALVTNLINIKDRFMHCISYIVF
jgi:hypothetical protein